jgi:EpsI family protein
MSAAAMAPWRQYVPAGVLALGCALLLSVRSQEGVSPAAPLTSIPGELAGYPANKDVTIGEDERRVAGMSDYVMRVYQRDSTDAFSVYVGYYESQRQGKTIHSPRNCLPGAGWEVMQNGTQHIPAANGGGAYEVNRYVLANGSARALVYYWYQGRGRVAWNEYAVKWNLLRDAALTGRTEEALVRIVVPLSPMQAEAAGAADPSLVHADSVALAAATRLIPEVRRVLPPPPSA